MPTFLIIFSLSLSLVYLLLYYLYTNLLPHISLWDIYLSLAFFCSQIIVAIIFHSIFYRNTYLLLKDWKKNPYFSFKYKIIRFILHGEMYNACPPELFTEFTGGKSALLYKMYFWGQRISSSHRRHRLWVYVFCTILHFSYDYLYTSQNSVM